MLYDFIVLYLGNFLFLRFHLYIEFEKMSGIFFFGNMKPNIFKSKQNAQMIAICAIFIYGMIFVRVWRALC